MRRTSSAVLGLLTLLASLSPLAPAAPAGAEDAPPGSVTLVGDLQDEAGCPADWAPDCAATGLTLQDDGTWSLETELPAGDYRFKVAIDGSWAENYGAGGEPGGAELPLVLTRTAQLRFTYDDTTHRIAVAPAERPSAEPTDADRALAGDSLRGPLTREQFYFVMADRFANGDPSNDAGGLAGDRLATGFDPTDKGFFHGGDVQGLSDRLDYIDGLGTTAIWLTPSFKNRPVQGTGPDASAGYHGYWVTDFTQIDPHFGTNAELEAFVDEAHGRGIKVFFDIITNHTADVIDY
ncbi:MAG TPA: alpha-amylase family glycosyl hydrolase [Nocardioides sp.]|nr:alpha-amylase family glycosyl hydrolase [Nocardioides sp.]